MKKRNTHLLALIGVALATAASAFAGSVDSRASTTSPSSSFSAIDSTVKQWWNGSSALGNWFGLGYPLQDNGLTVTGRAKQTFDGQIS